ncbi:MAG: hypothetical protein AB1791_02630 [Chloroflexota bacterium]
MDFGSILKRSWNIVWKHKFLWLLGFLAALGSGPGNGGNRGGGPFSYQFDGGEFDFNFPSFGRLLEQYAPILIALACLGLFLGLFLWLLHLVADAGLIRAAADLDRGDPATLSSSLSAGVKVLGRLVGVNLILYLPLLLLFAVLFGVFFLAAGASLLPLLREGGQVDPRTFGASMGLIVLCLLPLVCLLLPLALLVGAIQVFARRGVVLQDLGVIASISHGWQVIRRHLGQLLILAVILIVLGAIFTGIVGLIVSPLAIALSVPTIYGLMNEGVMETGRVLLATGGGLCLGLLVALLASVWWAYQSTVVTLAYQELVGKEAAKA